MNILIVRTDKLGDFITALPACAILKQHLHDAHITVLIQPMNKSIADACGFIDEIILDNKQSTLHLAKELRAKKFDMSFTLFSNTRVAIAQWLAFIPKRFAPATKIAQIFYNKRILQKRSQVKMAEFEYNMQLIQAAFSTIDVKFEQPLLQFVKEEIEMAQLNLAALFNTPLPIIAFHPGFGGSSDANWNIMEYIALAKSIESHSMVNILFTFGPGDEKHHEAFLKHQGDLKAAVYISKTNVLEFAKLISCFSLFISTSTGTFHLASAVGTKTMTFFADSLFASAKRWKGIGDESLQHNYMLPLDSAKRNAMFEQVKLDLDHLISADDFSHKV